MLSGDRWVTGMFDRVTISRDADGKCTGAIILDYKSNRVDTDAELERTAKEYQPQLSLYSEALAAILNIPKSEIQTRIIFTRAARVLSLHRT